MNAGQKELKASRYNEQGPEIIKFAHDFKIPLIKDLDNNLSESDFRDKIHLNSQAQKHLAENVIIYFIK